jgi:biopolymer transport protein ExbD
MNKHRKPTESEKPQVPITPMLDLTFQLLFFFISLFDPNTGHHKVEGQMDLMLPASAAKQKQAKDANDVDPLQLSKKNDDEIDLEIQTDLTVVVNTQDQGDDKGKIAALFIENRGPRTPIDYDKDLTVLTKYLTDERAKSDSATIRVQGDSKVHWSEMIRVMDACRKAGFKDVGFVQPQDYGLTSD